MSKPQQDIEQELAPFDDCRAALSFALNAHLVTTPTAFMNKAMAAVRVEMKKPKKRRKGERELMGEIFPGTETPEQLLEMERKRMKEKRGGSLVRVQALRFRDGLDKHHLAGLILHHFERLDVEHQVVLRGLLITAYTQCSCKAMCCSGWRMSARWGQALSDMCAIIQLKADVLKEPGKKGLSSQPKLRRMIVESFFTKRELAVAELARATQVGYVTAAKHREWITSYLGACENAAWAQLAPIFDTAGITGDHL